MNLTLLNIGYSDMNANWNWKGVHSPFARIYYVTNGEARTRIGGRLYHLLPGRLYLTPPFALHDDECDSLFSLYYIHFYEETDAKESVFDIYDFPAEVVATRADLPLTQRLLEINPGRNLSHFDPGLYDNIPTFRQSLSDNRRQPQCTQVETQGILCQLMSRFFADARVKAGNKDARIKQSLSLIHGNIDKDISVAALARRACITTDHFIRIFRRELGFTPLEYINMKKMEKAQLLLLTTAMPVKEIAFELSIDNVSYFNRIFKRFTGHTPGSYRREYSK